MLFHPSIVSLILAILVTSITLTVNWFTGFGDLRDEVVVYIVLFGSSFGIIYLALEYMIFREINKIYTVLDRIKHKDLEYNLKDFKKAKKLPIKRKKIYEEVYTYVTRKQSEIKELKKLEQFRREFLADISHELKTPIFAAQGYIHTLLDGAMNDKSVREKFLKKAAKTLDGMQEMVNELVVLSQLETGELKMNMAACDVRALAEDVFELLEFLAKKHNTTLKIASNMPKVWVNADAYQLKQVIKNLVENAIVYGHEGGKVTVSFDADKENVIISVNDDGPGIPPEHLKRIFDRFYRVEKSRSKEKGGTGLGLAIVQEIVEAHHSKVMVTSKVGKGTTFAFILKKLNDEALKI